MMTKEQMAEAILALPDDATVWDAIERLEHLEWPEQRVVTPQPDCGGGKSHKALTRDELAERIRALPDDATVDDAIERLEFIKWLEARIADADAHPEAKVSQTEAKRRFAQWLR
jgi:hypothetical protein